MLKFASLGALAAASGCGQPPEEAVAQVDAADDIHPGDWRYYATGWPFMGVIQPLRATIIDGRPIKLEGNPDHKASKGATDVITQAAILSLYDPERLRTVQKSGEITAEGELDALMARWRTRLERGESLRILTGNNASPTLIRQITELKAQFPDVRWHQFEPASAGEALDEAPETLICFGADPLGPGPFQTFNAGEWAAARRKARENGEMTRLFVAEAAPTLTGARADKGRFAVPEERFPALLDAFLAVLRGENAPELSDSEARWVQNAAQAARDAPSCRIMTGAHLSQPARNKGRTAEQMLSNASPRHGFAPRNTSAEPFAALLDDLENDRVGLLLMLDTNPVYAAPAAARFPALMNRAEMTITASLYLDETSLASDWSLPLAHPFETWSDGRAADGSAVIIQPLTRPQGAVKSAHQILARLQGDTSSTGLELVQTTWANRLRGDFEESWRRALQDGMIAESLNPPETLPESGAADEAAPDADSGIALIFRPDPHIWDGRFAENIWLQEAPRPLSKIVWRNAAAMSRALADELGVREGDVIEIAAGGRSLTAPAHIDPGMAGNTIALTLGYGRKAGAGAGNKRGYDAYPLRNLESPWRTIADSVRKTGKRAPVVTTQLHDEMEGHDFVRTVKPGGGIKNGEDDAPSLYPDRNTGDQAWAMTIDLDLCIGCNACVTACQSENNIEVVGEEQVEKGREMHWLRIDRYYEGPEDAPEIVFQPVPCMHCEQAPCEMGCPVNATVHSPDGLNLMIYNRCVGTRTCQGYCPYKVRRFNFFEWSAEEPHEPPERRNPEVTVRARGVMEKCTYCVQRIQSADQTARMEDRPIADGEVVTACQSACPTNAIVFGDKSDPQSAVSRDKADPRNYDLLSELGVRPRTSYLARVRDDSDSEG